jgi:hypothetical protein
MKRRRLTALAAATSAAVGIALAGPAQAASGCTTYYYADGKAMFKACLTNYVDLADDSWITYQSSMVNPTVGQGGHSSDVVFRNCVFNVSGDCTGATSDGTTDFNNNAHTLNDAATFWECVKVVATWTGSTVEYNRQVSFNRGGGISVTVSTTCGPATV